MNYALARENMVESQVRPNGITDRRIIAAMADVAREAFVGETQRAVAYAGGSLALANGRAIAEPMVLAKLIQLADITAGDRVLHAGCGTGYGTAVLAQLGKSVVAIDSDAALAAAAKAGLASYPNVTVKQSDLAAGERGSTFDVILIEGLAAQVPQALFDQLAEGGRLVAVVGVGEGGKATLYTRTGGLISSREVFDAAIAPLPGFGLHRPAFVF